MGAPTHGGKGRSCRKELGRPREFDRDMVLDAVMKLFSRHGYEGATFAHIEEAAGLSKPGLYACFGNKEQLFREALDRYNLVSSTQRLSSLNGARSLIEAISLLLLTAAKEFARPETGLGCMVLTGMISNHPDHEGLADELVNRRQDFHRRLAGRLESWTSAYDAKALAHCLVATIQGLALQAHDGASEEDLINVAHDMAAIFGARHSSSNSEVQTR